MNKTEKTTVNTSPHVVAIDGMNFFHRCRAGFNLGDAAIVFNAFRNLRALIEKHKPTRVYMVMEGRPEQRIEQFPEYKANRGVELNEQGTALDPDEEKKRQELVEFFRQVYVALKLMESFFPVSIVRHPRHEADDTIYNLIKRSTKAVNWTVVSNDSDFTQLLNEFSNVSVWNPHEKSYVEWSPDVDYVAWKSLKGDGSDNIPGIPQIGESRAHELMDDPDKLAEVLHVPENGATFERNYELIKFITWSDEEAMEMISSSPSRNWDAVRAAFELFKFKSILAEPYWTKKFLGTYDPLFGDVEAEKDENA